MKLSDHVACAIEDRRAGKFESALMHACVAVDGTAKRLYPNESGNRERCVRSYYWLIEPMLHAGLNLTECRFENVPLKHTSSPDFADIVYAIFRCSLAHGDEVPDGFSVLEAEDESPTRWRMGYGELHMPKSIVPALLAVTVFSKINRDQTSTGGHFLSLDQDRFIIAGWWGREDDFRPIAASKNTIRVTLKNTGGAAKYEGGPRRDYVVLLTDEP